MRQRDEELADAVESLSHYGRLERNAAHDVLLVPPVIELDGDRLNWSFPEKVLLTGAGGEPKQRLRDSDRLRRRLREEPAVDAVRNLWRARRVIDQLQGLNAVLDLAIHERGFGGRRHKSPQGDSPV